MSDEFTPSRPLLRYHGGKWRIAPKIIEHLPDHQVYVEPYGGAASVLLRKARSYAEVYNDLDEEIVNLFSVARDRSVELVRAVELTPYSRRDFEQSFTPAACVVERARRTVVRSFMGFGGNLTRPNRDQTPQRTGFREYTKFNRRSTPCGDWRNWPPGLVQIIERLQGVVIENRPAIPLILKHDSIETAFYVDPPYVHSTRGADCGGSHRGYRFEMSDDQHAELAEVLHGVRGGGNSLGLSLEALRSALSAVAVRGVAGLRGWCTAAGGGAVDQIAQPGPPDSARNSS